MGRNPQIWYRRTHKCWYATIGGKQTKLSPDKTEALRIWHARMAAVQEAPSPGEDTSVSSLIEAYLKAILPTLKPSTRQVKQHIMTQIKVDLGHHLLSWVNVDRIKDWINSKDNYNRSTKWLMSKQIKALFNWAVNTDKIDCNSISKLQLPAPNTRDDKCLITPDQHTLIYNLAHKWFKDVLLMLHETGCRPCEVCDMKVEDMEPGGDLVVMRVHKTDKTNRPRLIYNSPNSKQVCLRLCENRNKGRIFKNRLNHNLHRKAIEDQFRQLRDKLKLPETITAYSYRHTFATDALAAGVPEAIVAMLLGHRGTAMLHKHYSHLEAFRGMRDMVAKVRPAEALPEPDVVI